MKPLHLIGPLILISALSSCMWGVPKKTKDTGITTDTLTYTYETVKQRADDCGDRPDSSCTVAIIKYAEFKDAGLLNDSVRRKLNSVFDVTRADSTPKMIADYFMGLYKDYKKLRPINGSRLFFALKGNAQVLRQDSSLTTLVISGFEFMGGPHPQSFTHFVNWDTRANKNLQLSDILMDGYADKLNKVGDSIFRKQEKLSDTASLAHDYFFKGGKFALNSNFSITPLGIRFLYNTLEIKPYAAGTTDLFIPYKQIKGLLKPHTVLAQYHL